MFGEPITYGGQESVVYNMLSTFSLGNEFNIDLFTPYFADNDYLVKLVDDNNGNVFQLGIEFKTNDNRFMLYKYINNFFSSHNNYDVVHIHTGSLSTMVLYSIFAKKYGIKKVIVHSHIAAIHESLLAQFIRFVLCELLYKFADVYLGCSRNAIETKFTKKIQKKAIVVYNGINIDKFRFNISYRKEIRDKLNIGDRFVIGILGRLSRQKNVFFALDIISEIYKIDRRVVLLIVGAGELEEELIKAVSDKCIVDCVIFAGNQVDNYKYYSAFDAFILPSIYEGLPVTSIEAQVSGLSTLISNCITSECKISNGTKFLPIDNVKVWSDELLNIKNNYYNVLKSHNIDRINNYTIDFEKFDRNITFKKVEDIYKS